MENYIYLGTSNNKNKLRLGIEKRITDANRAYSALLPLLTSQPVLRAEKIKTTLIRPAATNGAETSTLNKNIAKELAAFERKDLRRMCGGIKVNKNLKK